MSRPRNFESHNRPKNEPETELMRITKDAIANLRIKRAMKKLKPEVLLSN